ncbi:ATP-binding protein, partial [Bacteriovoracaceae bacterium]|nr:ATP-binding protein [Bacteriovoracaceae bacterium]
PNRLKQIITNLLSNAIKFTSDGKIILKADYVQRNGSWLVKISIIDNGIGISMENQEEIFKSFKQEDSSTSRKYGGTGLGLSICAQLSQVMQGSLTVDSEVGKGSTFSISLPLELDEKVNQNKVLLGEESKINLVNQENYPHHILVVEDNEINQRIACSLLGKLGYDVDKANNGKEAIELAKKRKYSLIFMDMQMPEVDGIEATRQILKDDPLIQPKIIAMTANIFEEDKKNCFDAGMIGFINKPFTLIDIKKAILAA